jgi:putative lumazine-binding protein
MGRIAGAAASLAACLLATTWAAGAADADRAAIEAVVKAAYVDGVHAKGDPALMRRGFHPDFRMLTLRDGTHTFTDYLSLYRFPDGWKIVSKTFQPHGR